MWRRMEGWFGRTLQSYSRGVHKTNFALSGSVVQVPISFELCSIGILVA
jgi:hypothetical protein